jgi:hypothetical protein
MWQWAGVFDDKLGEHSIFEDDDDEGTLDNDS